MKNQNEYVRIGRTDYHVPSIKAMTREEFIKTQEPLNAEGHEKMNYGEIYDKISGNKPEVKKEAPAKKNADEK